MKYKLRLFGFIQQTVDETRDKMLNSLCKEVIPHLGL